MSLDNEQLARSGTNCLENLAISVGRQFFPDTREVVCRCIRDIFEATLPVELLSWRPEESIRQQLGQSFSTLSNGSSFSSLVSAPVSPSPTPVPPDDREHSMEPQKQAPSPEPQSPKAGSPIPPTQDEVEHETRATSPTNQNVDEHVEAPHITVTEENDGFVHVGEAEDTKQQEKMTEQSKDDQRTVEIIPEEEEKQLSLRNGGERADEELRTPSPPPITTDHSLKLNLEPPPASSTVKHKSKTTLTPTDIGKDKPKKSGGGLFRSKRDKSTKKDKSENEKKKEMKEKKKGSKKGEKLTKEVVDDNHSETSFGPIENDMTQAQPRSQKPSS